MRLTTGNLILVIIGPAVVGAIVAVATPIIQEARRPDVTDPTELARLPLINLRDSELETLVRAAFRNAAELRIDYEGSPSTARARYVIITDHETLDRLAMVFALGTDEFQLPPYPYPGMMYTRVRLDGSHQLDFVFTSPKDIFFYSAPDAVGSPRRTVRTQFAKALADELGLVEKRE